MSRKESILETIAEVLDGTELRLKVDSYRLQEEFEAGICSISCEVHHEQTGEKKVIEGHGVGIVSAFFQGMITLYSEEFPSLDTVQFSHFSVSANLETGKDTARTDSNAEVTLRIKNSEGYEYTFNHTSPSITRSSIECVLQAAAFFINSERAFIAVHRALEHARAANRPDSVSRYTAQLTTLVEATSYTEVILQQKRDESPSDAS